MLRKVTLILVAFALVAFVAAPAYAQTGNGAPSGSHYSLNIIGFDKAKKADLDDSNRHTIFVALFYDDPTPTAPTPLGDLVKKNKIFLEEGEFQVLDGNAWDSDGATFQLPAPGCTWSGSDYDPQNFACDYSVWVRGLGSPKKIDGVYPYANITTCGIDNAGTPGNTADDTYQCSTETVTVERRRGKSTFENVTKELLTMCVDTDLIVETNPCDVRVQLFDSEFYQYFWDYDNFGLRLAQLRFYPKNPE